MCESSFFLLSDWADRPRVAVQKSRSRARNLRGGKEEWFYENMKIEEALS